MKEVQKENEEEARRVMGVIVWIAIVFVFLICGGLGWMVIDWLGRTPV